MTKYNLPITLLILTYSCKKDQIPTDGSATLQFSNDTIIFDTIFGSPICKEHSYCVFVVCCTIHVLYGCCCYVYYLFVFVCLSSMCLLLSLCVWFDFVVFMLAVAAFWYAILCLCVGCVHVLYLYLCVLLLGLLT